MDGKGKHGVESSLLTEAERKSSSTEHISVAQLQQLVRLLDNSEVSEIEVRRAASGMRLVIRKARLAETQTLFSTSAQDVEEEVVAPVETKHTIVAPLVGIFHSWAKPRGKALVAIGDRIKVGQLVGTIQSLNVINEVESTLAGRVTELLVQDGQAVEYGQPLLAVDSSEES